VCLQAVGKPITLGTQTVEKVLLRESLSGKVQSQRLWVDFGRAGDDSPATKLPRGA